MFELINRIFDVESAKMAIKENRTFESVRSESKCEIKDGELFLNMSSSMSARLKRVLELANENRLDELDK